MHFVTHQHLRPTQGPSPPSGKPPLTERLKRNWLFVLYGVVCVAMLAAIVLIAPFLN
jgi:hypothetical protein